MYGQDGKTSKGGHRGTPEWGGAGGGVDDVKKMGGGRKAYGDQKRRVMASTLLSEKKADLNEVCGVGEGKGQTSQAFKSRRT